MTTRERPTRSVAGAWLMRAGERAIVWLLAAMVLLWVADFLVFHYRLRRGSAYDSAQVDHYMAVPLKNGREQYAFVGSDRESCSRTLFPQSGATPCWYLRRHRDRRENVEAPGLQEKRLGRDFAIASSTPLRKFRDSGAE